MNPKEYQGTVVENHRKMGGICILDLTLQNAFPQIKGGEFLMCGVGKEPAILLRRPMAVFDVHKRGAKTSLRLLYSVVGRGTAEMYRLEPGHVIQFFGPLGNSFPSPEGRGPVLVVAGGIGIAPFLLWIKGLTSLQRKSVKLLFGFRTKEQAQVLEYFPKTGTIIKTALDAKGKNAVDLLSDELTRTRPVQILTCGPPKMMDRVIEIAAREKVDCFASVEAKMGCGMGVCLSCAIRPPGVVDGPYALVCRDGPVFKAQ